ncbi:MAG: DNA polymerase III subunit delta [Alicyclobacillaceae bacterium]|nr:DNA polymerase III subunit delta [Alicyclobacillaceae bacterium]
MYWEPWVQEIRRGPLSPLYALSGTESYVIDLLTEEIRSAVGIGMPELNAARFDLNQTPVQQVVLEAQTPPVLEEKRLVVAAGGEALAAKGKVDHDLAVWEAYTERPNPQTVLVLILGDHKVDERKKWVKAIKEKGRWWVCPPLKEADLVKWIRREAVRLGIRLHNEAVERLLLSSGGRLDFLAGEMEKLSLFAPGGTLTREDVDALTVPFPDDDVFRWIDDLVSLRMDKVMTGLENLLKQRESPVKLLMLAARQYRLMYHVSAQSERGYSLAQIAEQLGAHPYACRVAQQQARRYTRRQIGRILQRLADVDAAVKTGRKSDRDALVDFALQLPGLVREG